MKCVGLLVVLVASLFIPPAQSESCTEGVSAGAACSHVEFVGRLTADELGGPGEDLNDVWGWVDPLGVEYVLVGMEGGTAFVRIQPDGSPLFLGRLKSSDNTVTFARDGVQQKHCNDDACGSGSAWRDIKVYDHYAYIVSEAEGHGMQVFNLDQLASLTGSPPQELLADSVYRGIKTAHNIFINEDTAHAYIVGYNEETSPGGMHMLDLAAPGNPVFIANIDGDGYTHDVQCVAYKGPDSDIKSGSELCFASNEETLTVWDVTNVDPATGAGAKRLARTPYPYVGYTHQGWLSENQHYFFLNDELDEQSSGVRTLLRIFDVRDVNAPKLENTYFAPTLAIDHNNYVHGRWLFQSNYLAGFRILDVKSPKNPVEAAFFDPQPADSASFLGSWSNYLFPSGLVAFTDIEDGLYIVRPTLEAGTPRPDLTIDQSLDAETLTGTEQLTVSIKVRNSAASDASDMLMTFHMPSGGTIDGITPSSGWTCETTSGKRVALCRAIALAAGNELTASFVVKFTGFGQARLVAMAYANEADANPSDNLETDFVTVTSAAKPPSVNVGGGALLILPLVIFVLFAGRRRSLSEK